MSQGFGNWSEPQDDPFSCQEDPLSAPKPVFDVCSSMLYGHYGGPRRDSKAGWVGIIQIGDARGMGILFGLGCDHQRVVALDLQLAAAEYGIVAQVGIETNVPARLRVLVAHRFVRGVPHQLVQAGDWGQLIPIHPANAPDTLVTRPADTPAQEEVMLSPVQAGPGVSAGTVNELPMPARLCALQPDRMHPGVAHQPCPPVTFQPGM